LTCQCGRLSDAFGRKPGAKGGTKKKKNKMRRRFHHKRQ
jgi:hypothetical protein